MAKRRIKLTKNAKVEVAAELAALMFLSNIYEGYYQDFNSNALFSRNLGKKFKFLDKAEQIPVVSDTNMNQLKDLLVKFYKRTVELDIK